MPLLASLKSFKSMSMFSVLSRREPRESRHTLGVFPSTSTIIEEKRGSSPPSSESVIEKEPIYKTIHKLSNAEDFIRRFKDLQEPYLPFVDGSQRIIFNQTRCDAMLQLRLLISLNRSDLLHTETVESGFELHRKGLRLPLDPLAQNPTYDYILQMEEAFLTEFGAVYLNTSQEVLGLITAIHIIGKALVTLKSLVRPSRIAMILSRDSTRPARSKTVTILTPLGQARTTQHSNTALPAIAPRRQTVATTQRKGSRATTQLQIVEEPKDSHIHEKKSSNESSGSSSHRRTMVGTALLKINTTSSSMSKSIQNRLTSKNDKTSSDRCSSSSNILRRRSTGMSISRLSKEVSPGKLHPMQDSAFQQTLAAVRPIGNFLRHRSSTSSVRRKLDLLRTQTSSALHLDEVGRIVDETIPYNYRKEAPEDALDRWVLIERSFGREPSLPECRTALIRTGAISRANKNELGRTPTPVSVEHGPIDHALYRFRNKIDGLVINPGRKPQTIQYLMAQRVRKEQLKKLHLMTAGTTGVQSQTLATRSDLTTAEDEILPEPSTGRHPWNRFLDMTGSSILANHGSGAGAGSTTSLKQKLSLLTLRKPHQDENKPVGSTIGQPFNVQHNQTGRDLDLDHAARELEATLAMQHEAFYGRDGTAMPVAQPHQPTTPLRTVSRAFVAPNDQTPRPTTFRSISDQPQYRQDWNYDTRFAYAPTSTADAPYFYPDLDITSDDPFGPTIIESPDLSRGSSVRTVVEYRPGVQQPSIQSAPFNKSEFEAYDDNNADRYSNSTVKELLGTSINDYQKDYEQAFLASEHQHSPRNDSIPPQDPAKTPTRATNQVTPHTTPRATENPRISSQANTTSPIKRSALEQQELKVEGMITKLLDLESNFKKVRDQLVRPMEPEVTVARITDLAVAHGWFKPGAK